MRRIGAVLALGTLACGSWWGQRVAAAPVREAAGARTVGADPAVGRRRMNPTAELALAVLGGFRGILSEFVWFRADRLQDEGRYAELAQLATTLTFLEPHTPEVWTYAAWNLAYNVSVMMPSPDDRWRWVEAGIRLLRDDGLALNPGDSALCRELAWLFFAKVGGTGLDSAAPRYAEIWKGKIERARATGDWREAGLDPAKMAAVDAEYGALDWTHPNAAALYWSHAAIASAKTRHDRAECRRVAYQTLMRLTLEDRRFAARALLEMRLSLADERNNQLADLAERFRRKFLP